MYIYICTYIKWETKLLYIHIYIHLASVTFEHSACRGSLMTTYITLLVRLIEHYYSLVPAMCNRASCVQVHELPKGLCGDKREGTLLL